MKNSTTGLWTLIIVIDIIVTISNHCPDDDRERVNIAITFSENCPDAYWECTPLFQTIVLMRGGGGWGEEGRWGEEERWGRRGDAAVILEPAHWLIGRLRKRMKVLRWRPAVLLLSDLSRFLHIAPLYGSQDLPWYDSKISSSVFCCHEHAIAAWTYPHSTSLHHHHHYQSEAAKSCPQQQGDWP